jgi:hypothetical protein
MCSALVTAIWLLYVLEYWQWQSMHWALRIYQIAPQPHTGHYWWFTYDSAC